MSTINDAESGSGPNDRKSIPNGHLPVLLGEVIEALDPQPGQTVVDATAGRGGMVLVSVGSGTSGTGGAMIVDAGRTTVHFTASQHPSFKCHHTDANHCKCEAAHLPGERPNRAGWP